MTEALKELVEAVRGARRSRYPILAKLEFNAVLQWARELDKFFNASYPAPAKDLSSRPFVHRSILLLIQRRENRRAKENDETATDIGEMHVLDLSKKLLADTMSTRPTDIYYAYNTVHYKDPGNNARHEEAATEYVENFQAVHNVFKRHVSEV